MREGTFAEEAMHTRVGPLGGIDALECVEEVGDVKCQLARVVDVLPLCWPPGQPVPDGPREGLPSPLRKVGCDQPGDELCVDPGPTVDIALLVHLCNMQSCSTPVQRNLLSDRGRAGVRNRLGLSDPVEGLGQALKHPDSGNVFGAIRVACDQCIDEILMSRD